MRIVDLEEKDEPIWETPFDVKLQQIFTHSHFNYDKTALISALPHLEELISLPEKTKLLVQLASYTNDDGYFCGTQAERDICAGNIFPHLYQVKGYLLNIGLPPVHEDLPTPLILMLQQVGKSVDLDTISIRIYFPEAIKDPNSYLKYTTVEERMHNSQAVDECLRSHPVKIVLVESGKILYHNNVLEEQMEQLDKELEKSRQQ